MFKVGVYFARVDSVSVTYRCLKGGGYILGGRGRLCERCV